MQEIPELPIIRPYISLVEVQDDFKKIFESGIFTRGAFVDAFSAGLTKYVNAQYGFLLTSATTSLWICLRLLGIRSGDEVIVSDFSFPATANVVEDVGAKPIFADVAIDSFNMLPDELERKLSRKTRAVIFVDALGNPTGLHNIKEICASRNIPLIEDAACALGSSERGVNCGSIADLTCFSFHPRKLLCTGEGGAITTQNEDWAGWLSRKLSHGASGPLVVGLNFDDFGYNFRMSEIQAALGLRQLGKLDSIIDERRRQRDEYVSHLEPLGFVSQRANHDVRHNIQSLTFIVPNSVDRDALIIHLKDSGIGSTIGTYALSSTPYFVKRYNSIQPNALRLFQKTLTVPCFNGVDIGRVVESIKKFCL